MLSGLTYEYGTLVVSLTNDVLSLWDLPICRMGFATSPPGTGILGPVSFDCFGSYSPNSMFFITVSRGAYKIELIRLIRDACTIEGIED
jgi:hypothetical protein